MFTPVTLNRLATVALVIGTPLPSTHSRISDHAPATWGAAIDVPLSEAYVVGPGGTGATMPTPGAHQSVVTPELLKLATLSKSSVALIEKTDDRHAGNEAPTRLSLPADAMTATPAACNCADTFWVDWNVALLASQFEFCANPLMPMLMFTDTMRWPALRRFRVCWSPRIMSLKKKPTLPPEFDAALMATTCAPWATPSCPPAVAAPAAMPATWVPWMHCDENVQLSPALPPNWLVAPFGQLEPAEKQAWSWSRPENAVCWLSTPESMTATS